MALSTKLKVTLPFGTAVTAAAVTAYLIISTTNDSEKNKQVDEALENLELTTKTFEEEIIKAEEETDKKEAEAEEDLEKKSDEGSDEPKEDKKKEQEEPQDLEKTLAAVKKDVEALASAEGGESQVNIQIPKSAKPSSISQQESEPVLKGEPSPLPADEKTTMEGEQENFDTLSKNQSEEEGLGSQEKQLPSPQLETKNSHQEETSKDEGATDLENAIVQDDLIEENSFSESEDVHSQEIERNEEHSGDQDDAPETESIENQSTFQEGEASSSNEGENNGLDNEEGGSAMTPEQIEELIDLQGKMADFSGRLSNLLKGFR